MARELKQRECKIVCVAPDGSLEVWTAIPLPAGWKINCGLLDEKWDVVFSIFGTDDPPEDFGREVLGEL